MPDGKDVALRETLRELAGPALFFLALCLILALCALALPLGAALLTYESMIEWVQNAFLAPSVLVFLLLAARLPSERGGLLLVFGLLTAMLIREQNNLMDQLGRGSWEVLLTVFLVTLAVCVWRLGLPSARLGLTRLARSWSCSALIVGLALLLVYSRLAGMDELWTPAIPERLVRLAVRRVMEEGLELTAYGVILVGSLSYLAARWRDGAPRKKE